MAVTGKLVGSFTGTGATEDWFAANATPSASKLFNISLWGTFVATVKVQRSFDDGSTWVDCSRDSAGTTASYTAPASLLVEEPEAGVLYRLNCSAYTSGTINYRISQ